jgi:hypothetical protein
VLQGRWLSLYLHHHYRRGVAATIATLPVAHAFDDSCASSCARAGLLQMFEVTVNVGMDLWVMRRDTRSFLKLREQVHRTLPCCRAHCFCNYCACRDMSWRSRARCW